MLAFPKPQALSLLSLSLFAITANASYDSVTFFGDSLTDSGYFSPATKSVLALPESGKFTTNPDKVWSELLGDKLGKTVTPNIPYANQSGNNYAIGGARAGTDFVNDTFKLPVSSVNTQLNTHLAKGSLDPNGLYAVWIGANDLFAAAQDPAQAQSVVLSAVASNVGAIKTLKDNGANYILVANLPDIGLTPQALATGAGGQATETANLYNKMLLNGVKQTGANVIVMDTFSLIQEVAKNKAAYGFDNITGTACATSSSLLCGSNTLTQSNANNTYFFADGIHPTGKAHRALADYAYMVATAPSEFGQLVRLVDNESLPIKPQQGAWVSVGGSSGDFGKFSGDGSKIVVGAGVNHKDLKGTTNANSKAVTGAFLAHTSSDWQGVTTQFDIAKTGVGVYHLNQLGKVSMAAQAGLDKLEIDSNRSVAIGDYRTIHKGETSGKKMFVNLTAGVPMAFGRVEVEPYLGVDASRTVLDGLSEQSDSATALTIDTQKYERTQGVAGVKMAMAVNDKWAVTGDVYYKDVLGDKLSGGKAHLNSLPHYSFSTPIAAVDNKTVGASVGVQGQLGAVGVQLSAHYQKGDDIQDSSALLGVQYRF